MTISLEEFEEARAALITLDRFNAKFLNRLDENPELGTELLNDTFNATVAVDPNEPAFMAKASIRTSHLIMRCVISDVIAQYKDRKDGDKMDIVDLVREKVVLENATSCIKDEKTRSMQAEFIKSAMAATAQYQQDVIFGTGRTSRTNRAVLAVELPDWDNPVVADVQLRTNIASVERDGSDADIEGINAAKDRAEDQ